MIYKFTEIAPPDTGRFDEKFLDSLPSGQYLFKENKLYLVDNQASGDAAIAAGKVSAALRKLMNAL